MHLVYQRNMVHRLYSIRNLMRIDDHNKERWDAGWMEASDIKRTITMTSLIKIVIQGCESGVNHSEGSQLFNCKARLRSWSFF